MVDTVLYVEGEANHAFRILRAVKNRFGSTNEIGVFEMKDSGLVEVHSPSEFFLSGRTGPASGSVVVPASKARGPFLLNFRPSSSRQPLAFHEGPPRAWIPTGSPSSLPSWEETAGMQMLNQDIFVNVAGGMKVDEPGADLGLVAAMASSFMNKVIDSGMVVFGEVGSGEVRGISQPEPASRIGQAGV